MSAFFTIAPLILAIAATVLAFIFFVPEKNKDKFGAIGKILHDIFNFKFLIVEKVLQALYILSTAFVILFGFFQLFHYESGYHSSYYNIPGTWYGGYGLLTMILGPIAVRLAYELLMMGILLVKNVIQINKKLKNDNDDNNEDDLFKAPIAPIQEIFTKPAAPAAPATPVAPAAPAAPVAPVAPVAPATPVAPAAPAENNFCAACGKEVNPTSTFCPYCGTKRQ